MRAIIASELPAAAVPLRPLLLGLGVECGAADCVPWADLPLRYSQAPPNLVLIVLGPRPGTVAPLVQHVAATGTPVLAVGPTADSQQILQVIRAGAAGYLDETHPREELINALEKMRRTGAVTYRRGLTITVLAAAPGSGVTTVASSVAFALAGRQPGRVVLAEAAPGVPHLALNLNLQPHYTIADLAGRWDSMDATMVRRALVEHPAGVHVLAYKPETLQTPPLPPAAMRQTALLLGALFDYSVLDLGHGLDEATLEALALAGVALVVVRLDVPSLRLTRQLLRQLTAQNVPAEKLRLVANRYGQRRQVPWKKAGEVLGLPIREWIPDDPATINQACNLGQPLICLARRAAITRTFDTLVRRLNGAA
jgi:pilus assembly protein CpaE